jgi:hypothetical protein
MTRTRSKVASLLVATATLASLLTAIGVNNARAAAACAGAATQGCWTAPFSPFHEFDSKVPANAKESQKYPAAASVVMLPNGRIIYWNGLQNLEDCGQTSATFDIGKCVGNAESKELDLTGNGTEPLFIPVHMNSGTDLFCSDQRLLENGTLLDTGGSYWDTEEPGNGGLPIDGFNGLGELYGSKQTHTYNFATHHWSQPTSMHTARWYPTLLTLPSGNAFVAGGVEKLFWNSSVLTTVDDAVGKPAYNDSPFILPQNVTTTETWSLKNGGWKLNPQKDDVELPLFARLHLLPDGEIFYSGAGQMWGPAGESWNELGWNNMRLFDPSKIGKSADQGWRDAGMLQLGAMSGAASVLMPFDVSKGFNKVKVLVAGGVVGVSPDTYLATNLSQMVTLTKSASGWDTSVEMTNGMENNRRWFSSSVLLPNGQVVVVNGADKDEVVMPGTESPVHQAELFDPKTGTWTGLSSSGRDRTYHNSAMLLPDGSILVGGHAPINQLLGGQAQNFDGRPLGLAYNFHDPSFERFYPPYLYAGPRPSILTSQAHTTWGSALHVQADPNSDAPIDHFVISRLPSQTHITDADARTIILGRGQRSGSSISLTIPSNRSVVTPGFYYLFGISSKGVPSEATIIQIADPDYYIGASTVTPVPLVHQAYRTSSSAAVNTVKQPTALNKAAKRSSALAAAPAAVTNDTASPVTKTPVKPAHSSQAATIVITAVMGAVLVRRIRTLARSDP